MLHTNPINLARLLLSFSDAIDLFNTSISAHQMRTAYIAWQIALAAGKSSSAIKDIFAAALFHDAGALTSDEKIRLQNFSETHLDPHCLRSASLLETTRLLHDSAEIVRYHHRPWSDWNISIDTPDIFGAQVLCLADFLERKINRNTFILLQNDHLIETIISCKGTFFHPDIVDLFVAIAAREDFWLDLTSSRIYTILLHHGPFRNVEVANEELTSIASFFKRIIDFKSPFTSTHSTGVAESGALMAKLLGLSEHDVHQLKLAGYLHDIGKLGVPCSIIDKPGKLTKDEFAIMRQHTYFTYTVLTSIGNLDRIAEWAAFHHEKLDGSGYPFHVGADRLSSGSRILSVADIFTALAENRPYRNGMTKPMVIKIISDNIANNALDRNIATLLFDNYDRIHGEVLEQQALADMEYRKITTNLGNNQR